MPAETKETKPTIKKEFKNRGEVVNYLILTLQETIIELSNVVKKIDGHGLTVKEVNQILDRVR